MKKFKKAIALSLTLAMGLSLCACGEKEDKTTEATTEKATEATTEAPADGGDTTEAPAEGAPITVTDTTTPIQVYSWNEELGQRLDTHFRTKYPELSDLVKYNNLQMEGGGAEYPAAIQNNVNNGGEMYPSIVAADDAVAVSFMEQSWAIPVTDIGITMDMYANAYEYTIPYATVDGNLMGMCWQATPGVLLYRTDYAEEVLGFSDPESVQNALSDWDKFYEVAEKMKAAGYAMTSGPGEFFNAFIDNRTTEWVVDGALVIDPIVNEYLEHGKIMYDNDYTLKAGSWSADWYTGMVEGVFAYCGCTWFVPWCLNIEDTDAYGKYNVITGPASFHWGGTYLVVTKDCPNKELAALVLYTLCCDEEVMYNIFDKDMDFVNNQKVVAQLIADGKGAMEKLGGQNPLEMYDAAAKKIDLSTASSMDSVINNYIHTASEAYNTGEAKTVDDAIIKIKEQVMAAYSDIVVE